jgi:hypothetical protein
MFILSCLSLSLVLADEPVDSIALVEASVQADAIALSFGDREHSETEVFRRPLGEMGSWQQAERVAWLGQVTGWTDTDVQPGERWEYGVAHGYGVAGFVAAAIEGELIDQPGKVALVVEDSLVTGLQQEIDQLAWDLVGEGWTVVEHHVGGSDSPEDVKALLQAEADLVSVILIGHVPVPYSGSIAPDGHGDHRGAWAADSYYGDLDGLWTDKWVDITTASRPENRNVPGDGKFDQSILPSDVDLQVGRIDMFDLPTFEEDEAALLQRYFDRNHRWRHGEIETVPAVIIDDNFGTYAPGSYSAWLLSPVVGRDNLEEGDFLDTLTASPYLYGYGSGAGTYTQAGGVAKTQDFANEVVQGVFLMLFGSYFGDYDVTNNLLRASIAGEGNALTSVWGGRPIHLHHAMGIGETVGFSVRSSQNAPDRVGSDNLARSIHVALLGDPTLRAFPVRPPGALVASSTGTQGQVQISWAASNDNDLIGYHIYRASAGMGPYERLTQEPVSESPFEDVVETEGTWWWMVRAIKLQETSSGTFLNPSIGPITLLEVSFVPEDTGDTGPEDTGGEDTGGEDTGDGSTEQPSGCGCGTVQRRPGLIWLMLAVVWGRGRKRGNPAG